MTTEAGPTRLGIYGGSFDPIHLGHLLLADTCREACSLDEVWFLPCANPPHKPEGTLTPGKLRAEMIELICRLKETYRLKVAVVSNEGRELTEYRIKKFNLHRFVDFFVSSCFVHLRKPDTDIFKLALDVAQIPLDQIIYIEDRLLFVQVAATFGIKGIQHIDYQTTKGQLEIYGLKLAEEPVI